MKKFQITKIKELGQKINFTPKICKIVHPLKWKDVEEVYLLTIEAPELDTLRETYHLPSKECDFHITIGVKTKLAQAI